jgi:hypothetical protein
MKNHILILLFILITNNLYCQKDGKKYSISLLTYAPGTELYSAFGHSALRVQDFVLNKDYVYNYGTFNFDAPNFYLNFLKGKLLYRLSKAPTEYVISQNKKENRQIVENKFLLSPEKEEQLLNILTINYLPDNREYYYDFFFDNCATRIICIFDTLTNFQLNTDYKNYEKQTFRELTLNQLSSKPWIRLGMNIFMGSTADRIATPEETGFLPKYLHLIFRSNPELISTNEIILVNANTITLPRKNSTSITFGILLFLVVIISLWELKNNKVMLVIDHLIFWPAILIGILILFEWFYSEQNIFSNNLNLLWANPMLVVFLMQKKNILTLKIIIATCFFAAIIYTLLYTKEIALIFYILSLTARISLKGGWVKKS